jgi:hypothetical protein
MAKAISFIDWVTFVNGTQITGFDEGDGVVKFEWLGKDTHSMGADGIMTIYLTADKSVKVTLTLAPTSSGNALLSTLYAAQKGGPRSFVPVVFSAKDSYRQDKIAGWYGYISSPASPEQGAKASKRVWEFTFERGVMDLADPTFAGLLTATAEAVGR